MTLKHKIFLLLSSLMVSFVGAMPANSIICVSESGEVKFELGFNGSCDCAEETQEHQDHDSCESVECTNLQLKSNDCSDQEIQSLESDQRNDFLAPTVFKITNHFDFKLTDKNNTQIPTTLFWPLQKPSIPPHTFIFLL
ncbi:hypothetical protein PQO03_09335 [Lentisphaera profundi]|uniref:Secreted protein n=1 Tax=Lentisphaera profundi TaxID=1658616 RepID=A0ABY7VP38_9BACT|nr:hypothetical protein [Lentisphaera profundi]WDE95916.1 hypothetical protein PQO03_09335 [Lentisphaera profundi]